jgi:Tfp pilus assembly protein PilF
MPGEPQRKTRRQTLEEHVAAKPGDAFARYGLALEYMNAGETAAADAQFKELLESNPDYVPAYLMYAQLLQHASRLDEARQILRAGVLMAAQKGNSHARSEMESVLADLG